MKICLPSIYSSSFEHTILEDEYDQLIAIEEFSLVNGDSGGECPPLITKTKTVVLILRTMCFVLHLGFSPRFYFVWYEEKYRNNFFFFANEKKRTATGAKPPPSTPNVSTDSGSTWVSSTSFLVWVARSTRQVVGRGLDDKPEERYRVTRCTNRHDSVAAV